ncbi:MAG: LysM peptidoglycan-binding domain-containing protein [Nitrososphaerales archaeon]
MSDSKSKKASGRPALRFLSLLIVPLIGFSIFAGMSIDFKNAPQQLTTATSTYSGPYASNLSKLVNSYVVPRFNANIDLIAQNVTGTKGSLNDLGQIYFENGTATNAFRQDRKFEVPCCSWKAGWGLLDNPPLNDSSMGLQILQEMSTLNATFGWHTNWKDDSTFGIPMPYVTPKPISLAYTYLVNGSYPEYSGIPYQIAQNSPYNLSCLCWDKPDMNVAHGLKHGLAQDAIYQSLNFFIRGDTNDSISDFQAVAKMWNGVGFLDKNVNNSGIYRGEIPALFLYAQKVLDVQPELPNNATLANVTAKLWSLQTSDGGIAYQYNSTWTNHSDEETSLAALLPYSPTLISYVQSVARSGLYNDSSPPPRLTNLLIDPFLSNSSTTTVTSTTVTTLTQTAQTTQTFNTTNTLDTTSTIYATQTINATQTTTRTVSTTQTSDTTQTFNSTATFSSTYQTTITQTVTTTQTSSVISSSTTTGTKTVTTTQTTRTTQTIRTTITTNYTYTVKSGDTLSSVARLFGVTQQSIINANHLKSPYKLTVGEKLIIPLS